MYKGSTGELVKCWGNWLGDREWNYFSTITYKHDIKPQRNEKIMLELETCLDKNLNNYTMFWIMEHTTNGYQTHNHLLLKGIGIKAVVNDFLFKKKLVNKKFIRHYEYKNEEGASYYVSKYIKSQNIKYGIAYSDNYKL